MIVSAAAVYGSTSQIVPLTTTESPFYAFEDMTLTPGGATVIWTEWTDHAAVKSGAVQRKPVETSYSFPTLGYPTDAHLASIGSQTMSVATEFGGIFSHRVDADGAPAGDPILLAAGSGMRVLALTADSDRYLAVWNTAEASLAAVLLDLEGRPITPVMQWSTTIEWPAQVVETYAAAAAWNGRFFVVAWAEYVVSNGQPQYPIYAIPVDANGGIFTPLKIADNALLSSIASDGHDFLVAWTERGRHGIYARSVSVDPKRLGEVVQLTDGEDSGGVYWDGFFYDVVFTRATVVGGVLHPVLKLMANRVEPDGSVVEPLLTDGEFVVDRFGPVSARPGHLAIAFLTKRPYIDFIDVGPVVPRRRAVRR